MVDARKQEWAKERRALVAKLDIRDQEAVIHKATLSQKNSEVCQHVIHADELGVSLSGIHLFVLFHAYHLSIGQ